MNIKYPIKHYSSIIVELVLLDILCRILHKVFLDDCLTIQPMQIKILIQEFDSYQSNFPDYPDNHHECVFYKLKHRID